MRFDFDLTPPTLAEILSNPLAYAWALASRHYRGDPITGRKRYGAFHAQLVEEVRAAPLVSVVVPRNHAKTTLLSQILTAWEIVRDPSGRLRVLMASATQGIAAQNCGKVREILEDDIEVSGIRVPQRVLFPYAAPVNPMGSRGPCTEFSVEGRSGAGKEDSVFVGSVKTGLAGSRFHLAVLDDIVNEQNCQTREQREKGIAFLAQVEALRYDQGATPIRMVSTPWAPGDTTDHVALRRGWRQIRHDLYVDEDPRRSTPGERRPTVCPDFINAEEANEMEQTAIEAGRYAFFSAQYRLRPMSSNAPLFTHETLKHAGREGLTVEAVAKFPHLLLWDPVASVDVAAGAVNIDRNGIAVVAVCPAAAMPYEVADPRRNIFVPVFAGEIAGGADDALREVELWIAEKRWPMLKAVWIEEVAAQSFLAPWARERGQMDGVRVRGQKIPSKSLTLRLAGLQTAMREGYFLLPEEFPGNSLLRQRLLNYPVADYDDLPAALCLLSYHWERRGNPLEEGSPPVKRLFEDGGPPPRNDPPGIVVF